MRRRRAPIRVIEPDPKYGSTQLAKFVNRIMIGGKKSIARKIVYQTIEFLDEQSDGNGLNIFEKAVTNVTPSLEVRSRRVGGANYQVPHEVGEHRKSILAHRWIINSARQRQGKSMTERLAQELLDASKGLGPAIKKKDDTHRMAEANRAFIHHRW